MTGPPVADRTEDGDEERLVTGVAGAAARLTVVFCSQPGPATVTWHWPGQQLPAGAELDRRSVTQGNRGKQFYVCVAGTRPE